MDYLNVLSITIMNGFNVYLLFIEVKPIEPSYYVFFYVLFAIINMCFAFAFFMLFLAIITMCFAFFLCNGRNTSFLEDLEVNILVNFWEVKRLSLVRNLGCTCLYFFEVVRVRWISFTFRG